MRGDVMGEPGDPLAVEKKGEEGERGGEHLEKLRMARQGEYCQPGNIVSERDRREGEAAE